LAYVPHPECDTPGDDKVLWHYMDFTKFVDLMETSELYLHRVDLLDDKREGRFTEHEYTRLSQRPDDLATSTEESRRWSFVNCWREGADESRAMWDLYGANCCGVAIKTQMKSLRSAIGGSDIHIHIGRVKYVDWREYDAAAGNLIGMCVRKSEGYMHEKEVRLLWSSLLEPDREPGAQVDVGVPFDAERVAEGIMEQLAALFPSADFTGVKGKLLVMKAWLRYTQKLQLELLGCGKRVRVDLTDLIDEVVVGPLAEEWLLDLTRKMLRRYNLSQLSEKVRFSELRAEPRRHE
jgi:hypothetical protein